MISRRGQENLLSVKGIDRELWKWVKARAALEGKPAGEFINDLTERYRQEAAWPSARLQEYAHKRNPHPASPSGA